MSERTVSLTASLEIESIAAGGDGVARHDGLVVFVARAAPGDRVVARIEQRGRLGRGIIAGVEREGPDRVVPLCAHYIDDACGGCQLQHLGIGAQRRAKGQIIADTFRRIGHRTVAVPPVRGGTAEWRYRRKLTLALRRDRGSWSAGLHRFDDPDRLVPLRDCRIAQEPLLAVWGEILRASASLPDANRLRGSVRLLNGSRASFTLEGGTDWTSHADFLDHLPSVDSLWWIPSGGARRLLHDRGEQGATPSASFVQVNAEMAAVLQAFVLAAVQRYQPKTVLDAYSGSGELAVALAGDGTHVVAVEMDEEASRWTASRLPPPSRAVCARVEHAIQHELPADVVVLNPPRGGLDARVAARLDVERSVRALFYVSCDPATLARDVSRMPHWRIADLTAFDMFPQTAHVETVCELVREADA